MIPWYQIEHKIFAYFLTLFIAVLASCYPAIAGENLEYDFAIGLGGESDDQGHGIAVDANGNIYATGFFEGTADFDPGPDTSYLTSIVGPDVFVVKLDSGGNLVWATQAGQGVLDAGSAITVDDAGNVYTTGTANGNFGQGGDPENTDVFVQKQNSNGGTIWRKLVGGPSSTAAGALINVDTDGNVTVSGVFSATVDFDPGPGTFELTAATDFDAFILILDADGNFVSATAPGLPRDSGNDQDPSSLRGVEGERVDVTTTTDGSGSTYTTGYFSGTVDFDPGEGIAEITSQMDGLSRDIFIVKLAAKEGVIISNLLPEEIVEGARLGLSAPNGGSSYQWLKDGELLLDTDTISGTTEQTLEIDPLSLDDSGTYTCQYDNGLIRAEVETFDFVVDVLALGGGSTDGGSCLIAHLTHGTPLYKELDTLRAFRDGVLLTNSIGSAFANAYYQVSPAVVRWTPSDDKTHRPVAAWFVIAIAAGLSLRGYVTYQRWNTGRNKS